MIDPLKNQFVSTHAIEKFSSSFSSFGTDYVFSHITGAESLDGLKSHIIRLGGMVVILCIDGEVDIDVNLRNYRLTRNSLIVLGPDSVINVNNLIRSDINSYVFIISQDFIRDINFELNLVATMSMTSNTPPLLQLTDEEVSLMSRYLNLIHYNTVDNPDARFVRSISRSLIAAAVYQLMQFVNSRSERQAKTNLSRRANYVKDFLHLVNLYHRQERGVAFYASKLFISPKYLSLIIKQSTGRSAAEWIDDYVILEAKNLLRFSGKNVQQIAYELNFSNQSSFGKYFKHLTGMSPTKFQQS